MTIQIGTDVPGSPAAKNPLPLSRSTLHARLLDALGRRVVAEGLAAAAPMPTEGQLAAAYGVSGNLLREATKVLASKGLLEARPKIGVRIRPTDEWNMLVS